MSYCCGRQGFGARQRGTTCTVWRKLLQAASLSWSWRSIKLLLLHLVGFYITLPTERLVYMGRPGLCAVQHSVISSCYLCIVTVQVTNALINLMKSNNTDKRHNEARSRNHFCRGKAIILHIMKVCLYSLLSSMQSECAILYCYMLPYFAMLSHKHHDFRGKKVTACKMGIFLFNFRLKYFSS